MRRSKRFFRIACWVNCGILVSIFFAGCVTQAFRSEGVGYNSAYTEFLNKQLLLNLARLDNGHPPQFLIPGAIQSHYNFAAGASGGLTQSHSPTTTEATSQGFVGQLFEITGRTITTVSAFLLGTNGSVSAAATAEPEFTWVPLNDDAVTQQVLNALPPDVFYTLYQQGYPIDQLMRVTVERIEVTLDGQDLVFTNSPTRSSAIQKPDELESFERFLRACAMLRELQRHGTLQVEVAQKFAPIPDAIFDTRTSESNRPPGNGGEPGSKEGGAAAGSETKTSNRGGGTEHFGGPVDPSPDRNIIKKGISPLMVAEPTPSTPFATPKNIITPIKITPIATPTPPKVSTPKPPTPKPATPKTTKSTIPAEPLLIASDPGEPFKPTPEEVITARKEGLAYRKTDDGWQLGSYVEVPTFKIRRQDMFRAREILKAAHLMDTLDDQGAGERLLRVLLDGFTILGKLKAPVAKSSTHLILRSFSRSLEATASEQNAFDKILKTYPEFRTKVPASECWPVLRTRWAGDQRLEPPLMKLLYMGKIYQITDTVGDKGDFSVTDAASRTWNRDVYRLLMALSAQVTVDISKFQRQVIELQQ